MNALIPRLLLTACVLVFTLAVPLLELNDSHLTHPAWPPHARFHEAWQLSTHIGIGLLSLWLVWRRGLLQLAAGLIILVMGGVLVAAALAPLYGGSVVASTSPVHLLGVDRSLVISLVVVILAFGVAIRDPERQA